MKPNDVEIVQLNKKQAKFLSSKQKTRVFLGGRGCGKSFTIGVSILMKAIELPRSKGAWASTTYTQMKSKMIESLKKAWKSYGLENDVHYVIGKKTPKEWATPFVSVENYANMITFYWGSACEMVSLERADNVRGGSFDYLEIDEAGLLSKKDYTMILLPCVRGNKDKFDSPYHQQVSFYTSIPRNPVGYWILEYEEKAKLEPDKYLFLEANAYDNIHILTAEGIQHLKEELDVVEFNIEVMNQRHRKGQFAFYDKFDSDKHTYGPNFRKGSYDKYDDIDLNRYLEVSIDFGGHINFMSVWQQHGSIERQVGEIYKLGSNSLKSVIAEFAENYSEQVEKKVKVWGEPRGWDAQPGSSPWFQMVKDYFWEYGWIAIIEAPRGYRTEKHETRQEVMNAIFEGGRPDLPTVLINEYECPKTIISLENTEVDSYGKKIKKGEQNTSLDQSEQPHGGDTCDYYIYFKYIIKPNRKKKRGGVGVDIETM